MEIVKIGTITDDCAEAESNINVNVIKTITLSPVVRLEVETQGTETIQFDIKTLDTGFKLIHSIAKAMVEAKVK